jgi:hypothetical protein
MPSCKSHGRKNKTMKKNTKKMQGGKDGEDDSNPPPVLPPPVLPPLVPQVNPNAVNVDPNSSKGVPKEGASSGIFSGFSSLWPFTTTGATKGGKRKSKSNKSYRKKSKYNKK